MLMGNSVAQRKNSRKCLPFRANGKPKTNYTYVISVETEKLKKANEEK